MPPLTLIHRTNYYGRKIKTTLAKTDQESGANALWLQCVPGLSLRAKECCRAFGDRKIKLTPNQFSGWLSSKGRSKWTIYRVNKHPGNSLRHHFTKYIIVQAGHSFDAKAENNFGRVGYLIKSHDVWSHFATLAARQLNLDDKSVFNHVHVGLVGTPDLRVTR